MLRNLNNGKYWEQVAKSWRTAGIIQGMAEILKRIEYKIINHVRRKGNKVADYLANWGCKEQGERVDNIWPTIMNKPRWEELTIIITQDHNGTTTQ